jgi:sugar/nucleoside kinase (ribokinase family)
VVRPVPNRSAVILVDERNGDRVVMVTATPDWRSTRRSCPRSALMHARAVHVDGADEAASIAAARLAREAGAHVTCDLESIGARTGTLLRELTVPILAQGLPEAITGERDPEQALRRLEAPHARLPLRDDGRAGRAPGGRRSRASRRAAARGRGGHDRRRRRLSRAPSSWRCCAATPQRRSCALPTPRPR